MTDTAHPSSAVAVAPATERADVAYAVDRVRVSVLGGGLLGLLIGGVGGRLAMLLLRVTSPDSVRGIESDDGFVIGQVTLFGTIGLLAISTAIGIVGAFGYRLVAPSLVGPRWFRSLTAALGAGAVVGSMLVHSDGVDFTVLEPAWLAVALFVAIPAAFGAAIGPVLERWDRSDAWVNEGRWRRWILPIAVVAFVPILLPIVVVAAVVTVAWVMADQLPAIHRLRTNAFVRNGVRVAWFLIALLGLSALVSDASAIV